MYTLDAKQRKLTQIGFHQSDHIFGPKFAYFVQNKNCHAKYEIFKQIDQN